MIRNLVLGNLTTGVAGMITDQSLANKLAGRFGADKLEKIYISGVAYKDPTDPTLVFQSYRANFDFTDYNNIAGLVLANNASTQPIEFNNDTPEDVILPIKNQTQFSIAPFNQLFQCPFWVRQGEVGGAVTIGQVLYKKVPTANDTGVDKSIYYAFNKKTTQDLTNFCEVGVMISQTQTYPNVSPALYPNCVMVMGTTYNVIVQHYAGATGLENNEPQFNKDEIEKYLAQALGDGLEEYKKSVEEQIRAEIAEQMKSVQNTVQLHDNQPKDKSEVTPTPVATPSDKSDKSKGGNK